MKDNNTRECTDDSIASLIRFVLDKKKFIFSTTFILTFLLSTSVFFQDYKEVLFPPKDNHTISARPLQIVIKDDIIYSWIIANIPNYQNDEYSIYSVYLETFGRDRKLFRSSVLIKIGSDETIIQANAPTVTTKKIKDAFDDYLLRIRSIYQRLQEYRSAKLIERVSSLKVALYHLLQTKTHEDGYSAKKYIEQQLFSPAIPASVKQDTIEYNLLLFIGEINKILEYFNFLKKSDKFFLKKIQYNNLEQTLVFEINKTLVLLADCRMLNLELVRLFPSKNFSILSIPLFEIDRLDSSKNKDFKNGSEVDVKPAVFSFQVNVFLRKVFIAFFLSLLISITIVLILDFYKRIKKG
ncbi:MAG: hypothetical protein HQK51_14095 [Oligoflexia bacterium]|nr:hypothetical protein [Oligoflexia bacterium]